MHFGRPGLLRSVRQFQVAPPAAPSLRKCSKRLNDTNNILHGTEYPSVRLTPTTSGLQLHRKHKGRDSTSSPQTPSTIKKESRPYYYWPCHHPRVKVSTPAPRGSQSCQNSTTETSRANPKGRKKKRRLEQAREAKARQKAQRRRLSLKRTECKS